MNFRIQSFRQAAFWSTGINAFSQGLALVFSMLMAALFGAQESTDVLFYCLGVFVLLSGLIQAVNVNVLIPETMRRRHQAGEPDAMAFINRFFAGFLLIILGLTAWVVSDPVGSLTMISKFPAEVLTRNLPLVKGLLVAMPLQMFAQLLLDVLVSYKFLTLPATLSCVSRIINILFVAGFHRQLGVVSFALGLVVGLLLQVLLNLYLLRAVIHWNPFAWKTRIGGVVCRNILWTQMGTVVSTAAAYIPLFLFSGFSAGILTALNYARRLSDAPVGLLTTQITGVVSIKFNELSARQQEAELAASFVRIARLILFVMVPLSILLLLTGPDIVRLLFGRGAFRDVAALELTSAMFSLFVVSMPLIGLMMIVARYFVAQQAIGYGTRWQIVSNLLFAAIVVGLVRAMGPLGFPIGIAVHLLVYMALLSVSMARRFPQLSMWPVWKSLGTSMAVGYLLAVPLWLARQQWGAGFSPWLTGAATAGLYLAAYGLLLARCPPDRMAWEYSKEYARLGLRKIQRRWRGEGGHA